MVGTGAYTEIDLDPVEMRYCRIYLPLILSRYAMRFIGFAVLCFGVFAIIAIPMDLLLYAAHPTRREPFAGIIVGILAVTVFVGLFALFHWADRATQRLGSGARFLWLIGPLLGVVLQVGGMIFLLAGPDSYGRSGGDSSYLVLMLLTFAASAYVQYVMIRAGLAIGALGADERALIRETARGSRGAGLIGLWNMPPTYAFARRSRRQAAGLVALALVSGTCFALATFLTMGLTAWYAFRESPLAAFVVMLLLLAAFVALGALSRSRLQRRVTIALSELRGKDPRPPLLFLRAFKDDQIPLATPRLPLYTRLLELGRLRTNLDRTLVEEGTPYGPVVALGKPGDPVPPYGAARKYVSLEKWQDEVAALAAEATAVAICIDDTEGIWWEVEHLVAHRHVGKTLFLIDPKHRVPQANAALFAALAGKLGLPEEAARRFATADARRPRVIGFHRDSGAGLTILTSSTFSHFAYLLALRQFLRARHGSESIPLLPPAAARTQ